MMVTKKNKQNKPNSTGYNKNKKFQRRRYCSICGKSNHNKDNCFFRQRNQHKKIGALEDKDTDDNSVDLNNLSIATISSLEKEDRTNIQHSTISTLEKTNGLSPCYVKINVNNKIIKMEVDSGACLSVISFDNYNIFFSDIQILKCTQSIHVVTGQPISVVGFIKVCVTNWESPKKVFNLKLFVIRSVKNFVSLLGRDWLNFLVPDWQEAFSSAFQIKKMHSIACPTLPVSADELGIGDNKDSLLNFIKNKYEVLFKKSPSDHIKDFEVDIYVYQTRLKTNLF